jgi:hypothetical protein
VAHPSRCMLPPVSREHLRTESQSGPPLHRGSAVCQVFMLRMRKLDSLLPAQTRSGTFDVFDALPDGAVPLPEDDVAAGVAGKQQRASPAECEGADSLLAPPPRISQLHHLRWSVVGSTWQS